MVASHRRMALCAIASKTGWRSVGELLITRRMSAVAVCCSRASFVSLNRRTFSIAITAWSANVFNSSIWASEKGSTCARATLMAPIGASSRIIGTDSTVRWPTWAVAALGCGRSLPLRPARVHGVGEAEMAAIASSREPYLIPEFDQLLNREFHVGTAIPRADHG